MSRKYLIKKVVHLNREDNLFQNILAIDNVAGPLGAHDGYLRRRPGHDIVCPEMIKLS
jgi:hypothetical protein